MSDEPSPTGRRHDWRGAIAKVLLGATAGGLTINILSNDLRWRAVAVALGLGSVLALSSWLHGRPRSPIGRWGSRALLVASSGAMLLAAFGPAPAVPWTIGAAVALAAGAALVPTEREAAYSLLVGAGSIGASMAFLAWAVATFSQGDLYKGIALLLIAVAAVGPGVARQDDAVKLRALSSFLRAVALLGLAAYCFDRGRNTAAAASILFAILNAWYGIAWLKAKFFAIASIAIAGGAAGAVWSLFAIESPWIVRLTIFLTGSGIAAVALGAIKKSPWTILAGHTALFSGILCFSIPLHNTNPLLSVILAISSLILAVRSVHDLLKSTTGDRLRLWWVRMISEKAE